MPAVNQEPAATPVLSPGVSPLLRPVDIPSMAIRWEGLVVSIDGTTLNAILSRATRRIREIRQILVEPEDGLLGLTVRIKRFVPVLCRAHLTSFRLKDGFLGFRIEDLTVFGFVPVPNWILRRIVSHRPAGQAFYYPEDRVFVVNLNSVLPPELSIQIREVMCQNGELRFVFGPSQYRLDRLIDEMGRDPFDEE